MNLPHDFLAPDRLDNLDGLPDPEIAGWYEPDGTGFRLRPAFAAEQRRFLDRVAELERDAATRHAELDARDVAVRARLLRVAARSAVREALEEAGLVQQRFLHAAIAMVLEQVEFELVEADDETTVRPTGFASAAAAVDFWLRSEDARPLMTVNRPGAGDSPSFRSFIEQLK